MTDQDTEQQWNVPEGTDVVGTDGGKVGEVVAAHRNYLVVEKGFFFPTDYYIPRAAVANFDGDKVYLSVTKQDALNHGWDQVPADESEPVGAVAAPDLNPYTTESTVTDVATEAPPRDTGMADMRAEDLEDVGLTTDVVGTRATGDPLPAARGTTPRTGSATDTADTAAVPAERDRLGEGDVLQVPVHEEELTATTRPADLGQVRIAKDVRIEERALDVPVTEERVRVSRRAVDRDAGTGDQAGIFEEGVIEVPVRGEAVDLHTRTRVAEEVEIAKETVQRTEHVTGAVRREEVHVTENDEPVQEQNDRGGGGDASLATNAGAGVAADTGLATAAGDETGGTGGSAAALSETDARRTAAMPTTGPTPSPRSETTGTGNTEPVAGGALMTGGTDTPTGDSLTNPSGIGAAEGGLPR